MKIIDHLKSRGLNSELYDCFIDIKNNIATFLLYNLSGQIVGYQKYDPSQDKVKNNDPKACKYYTYLPREVDGVFGLDLLNSLDRNIYITEGIFKAAKLHNLGYNSIAVLTSSPKRLRPWLYIMKQTWNLIAIGDNDKAGKGLIDMIGKGFQSPIDIDEMINYDVIKMIEENK